ncbi:30S ribosomal protein S1 [Camellia lanceoleosa]|uniref:30S ribosomal protein S1 n=1 Tax=Camellia lanceoleosa TaxID=1840588 RepID=A0ACC0FJK7_9ERIC|nr:30S ribosomal protein S1 [Camellia lanceoleosa]
MDCLALATATTTNTSNSFHIRFYTPSYTPISITTPNVSFRRKPCKKFLVFSSKDDPKLDPSDQMELKFGRLIGEDPKLTLAKIMSRKSNPDVSYLEVEKSFYKKKAKSVTDEIVEVPFDGSEKRQLSDSLNGLNLVRPVPKKGVKFEVGNKPIESEVKKPSQPVRKPVDINRGSLPNVILRKPMTFNEDDIGPQKPSKLRIKPNLSLKMGKEQTKATFSDITLLKKPEPVSRDLNLDKKQEPSGDGDAIVTDGIEDNILRTASVFTEATNDLTLLNPPKHMDFGSNINEKQKSSEDYEGSSSGDDLRINSLESVNLSPGKVNSAESKYAEFMDTVNASLSTESGLQDYSATELQPLEESNICSAKNRSATEAPSEKKLVDSNIKFSVEAALQGKPRRLDQSVKGTTNFSREEMVFVNPESYGDAVELENFLATSPIKQHEDNDWKRVEGLVKTGGREEVELISSSTRGFVVSFGSLIGILPYRNLTARWKFLAFESWLRRNGLDPSQYKHNLGIIGNYGIANNTSLDSSLDAEVDQKVDVDISSDMQLEDLLRIYDQEKLKFLSSFVGQKIKVNVVLTDRKSRKLIFSVKPKEKEEMVDKKRSLMAKLSTGDVVKCCIKKITYFGIFVEVEGVPALIHQSEVSWDATLDPASYFKVGQIVEAKVHQLDFSLERIFLSLKEITPDPLIGALEAVIGDNNSLDGRLEAAQADTEWADVESLINELQQFEGIESVSKGRFFLSPGLAPTFQVYMASMFENEYKLLARSENKVQEVIVETSLGKEEMKSAILTCTSRVE